MAAQGWFLEATNAMEEDSCALRGLAASPGIYEGPARLIAGLARLTGDVGLAEDALQDAFAAARSGQCGKVVLDWS